MTDYAECEHRWMTTGQHGTDFHSCTKECSHLADITNDDHRCCCGTTLEED